ncbi:MAG: molybdopterin-dependent oxidoreductase [Proteobacteria bacterium]|nr:molybdopterin-dependent oxidoreductase [Pseudomonadota bacterium]
MKIRGKTRDWAIFLAILGMAVLNRCSSSEEAREIREYQGQQLSSINDLQENSIKGAQNVVLETYSLSVTGLVGQPLSYTYGEVLNQFNQVKKVADLHCVEGWSATFLFEGIPLLDLLEISSPLPEARIVIFHSVDGFTTSLPLDYFQNNDIIMAFQINGLAIRPQNGFPFQLVAEGKWGYKWAKWISEIELSDDMDYRGFWESRGYSNTGNLEESFFGP